MKKVIFAAAFLTATFAVLVGSCASTGGGGGNMEQIEQAAARVNEGDYYAYRFEQYKTQFTAQVTKAEEDLKNTSVTDDGMIRLPTIVSQSEPLRRGGVVNRGSPSTFSSTGGNSSSSTTTPTSTNRTYGTSMARPRGITGEEPSEQDIDRAIAAYEAALAQIPAGTWRIPKNQYQENLLPPANGVKDRLAQAKSVQQRWLTAEKPPLDQRLATVQAGQQQLRELAQQRRQTAGVTAQQQQAAQQQAAAEAERQRIAEEERQRQAEEQQRRLAQSQTSPNSPDDFEIANSSLGGVKITRYKGTRPGVVIPSTIDGMRVTELDSGSFAFIDPRWSPGGPGLSGIVKIYSVTFPNTLIAIGTQAFYGQPITSVSFPNSLRTIREAAFLDCRITSVVIPNGVTFVDSRTFSGNPVTTVVIPPSLANYRNEREVREGFLNAFGSANDSINRITLPANVNLDNLGGSLWGFHDNLRAAYEGNSRRAGTYVWTGRIWRVE